MLVPVEKRDAATLIPLIQKHIRPGSVIHSDMWASYSQIISLPEGYLHQTVNHSQSFVDPASGAYTQSIESLWQKFKAGHKDRFGTHRSLFSSYVSEFVWRREFGGEDCLYNLWKQIAEIYPVE